MTDNLPALDVLLSRLGGKEQRRWAQHVAGAGIDPDVQTCHPVRLALSRGEVDEALYAALRAGRTEQPSEPQSRSVSSIEVAGERDSVVSAAISLLSAQRASVDDQVNVRLLRESIIGSAQPLSRDEAWAFLERGERMSSPIAWERLHGGWDLHPLMSEGSNSKHASLSFRDDAGHDHQFRTDQSSPLASLWLWANLLFTTYKWPRSQAAWFLLTGEPPRLLPVAISIEHGFNTPLAGTITVTTLAFGSEQSVPVALAGARRRLLDRRNGPLAVERYAMAEFVDSQFAREGERPSWQELWERWNAFAPAQWRLRGRRLRYPDSEAMLDAYRREKGVRRARKAMA